MIALPLFVIVLPIHLFIGWYFGIHGRFLHHRISYYTFDVLLGLCSGLPHNPLIVNSIYCVRSLLSLLHTVVLLLLLGLFKPHPVIAVATVQL